MQRSFRQTTAIAALIGFSLATNSNAQLPEIRQPEISKVGIFIAGTPTDVTIHIYKPNVPDLGPFPVVMFAHGRWEPTGDRRPPIAAEVANWWLAKGFAVIAPLRPGYGDTSGGDREDPKVNWQGGSCVGQPDYDGSIAKARDAMVATLAWAREQRWANRDRVILVGHSVGGLVTIATVASNPVGVLAAVNFAGGMGGNPQESPNKSCKPEVLSAHFAQYGERTRVPTLWLYAENDLLWGPDAPRVWFEAFNANSKLGTLAQLPPIPNQKNGHQLINTGRALWAPVVDAFLEKLGLAK